MTLTSCAAPLSSRMNDYVTEVEQNCSNWTDEQWEEMLMLPTDSYVPLSQQYMSVLYCPLDGQDQFLMLVDGQLWIVSSYTENSGSRYINLIVFHRKSHTAKTEIFLDLGEILVHKGSSCIVFLIIKYLLKKVKRANYAKTVQCIALDELKK